MNRRSFIYCSLAYGVVPKGFLTFLGSLYDENVKTTSGTLVYRFERQTARKKSSFQKHCVPNLECRILSQEHDANPKIRGVTGCHKNNCKHCFVFLRFPEFKGLNSALPKNPRKVNNPLEPSHRTHSREVNEAF